MWAPRNISDPGHGCGSGSVLVTSLGKEAHVDWIGVRTSLVDQHRHWMHQDAYGAHQAVIPTPSRSPLLVSHPGPQGLHFWLSHGQ